MIIFLIILIIIALLITNKDFIEEARVQYFLIKYPHRYYIDDSTKKLKQDYCYNKNWNYKYIKPRFYNRRLLHANKVNK